MITASIDFFSISSFHFILDKQVLLVQYIGTKHIKDCETKRIPTDPKESRKYI